MSPEVTYDTLPEWFLSERNNLSFFRLYQMAGTTQEQRQPARRKHPQIPKRKMITEITVTTEMATMEMAAEIPITREETETRAES